MPRRSGVSRRWRGRAAGDADGDVLLVAQLRDPHERREIRRAHDIARDARGRHDLDESLQHLVVHTINPFNEAVAAV